MAGMLLARLDNDLGQTESASTVEVSEDQRLGTQWSVNEQGGAVALNTRPGQTVPWTHPKFQNAQEKRDFEAIIVLPRANPLPSDIACLGNISSSQTQALVALLVPNDIDMSPYSETTYLRCPKSQAELDQISRQKLNALRVGRK